MATLAQQQVTLRYHPTIPAPHLLCRIFTHHSIKAKLRLSMRFA